MCVYVGVGVYVCGVYVGVYVCVHACLCVSVWGGVCVCFLWVCECMSV